MSESPELLRRVREALLRPELFDSLQKRRQEISELLESHDLELTPEDEAFLEKRPFGLERLYEFLAEESVAVPEEADALDRALAVREEDEKSIGLAFRNGLCRDLGSLADPRPFFKSATAKPASRNLVEFLRSRADVEAAWPAIEPLLQFGLTPTSVYFTCDAPRTVASRLNMTDTLIISPRVSNAGREGLLYADQIAFEAASLDDSENVSCYEALFAWLAEIQRIQNSVRQYMFRGYTTVVEGDNLRLTPVDGNQLSGIDPVLQWQPQPVKIPKVATELVGAM